MARLYRRSVATGSLLIQNAGMGLPGVHNQNRQSGNGFITTTRDIYYLNGITGNTVATVSQMDWTYENAGLFQPWDNPIAFTFFLVLMRIEQNESALACTIGGDAATVLTNPHNQWITSVRRRVGLYIERDAGGNIAWRMVGGNGTSTTNLQIAAIADRSWVSLIYRPSPRAFELWVNGVLRNRITGAFLPASGESQAGGELLTVGTFKKLTGAAEVSLRLYSPALVPARVIP